MEFAILFHCVGRREIFPKPASFFMKICDNFIFARKDSQEDNKNYWLLLDVSFHHGIVINLLWQFIHSNMA